MKRTILLLTCLTTLSLSMQAQHTNNNNCLNAGRLSLAGQWSVILGDATPRTQIDAVTCKTALLPGTIDTNHLGEAPTDTTETTHLTRRSAYKGAVSYLRQVDIPKAWKKKQLLLFLERTKPTWLYIDGTLIDSCNNISTPQRYLLPPLKPGKHLLQIVVDNARGVPSQLYGSSHAYTEDTQTNWNGVIGEMWVEASPPVPLSRSARRDACQSKKARGSKQLWRGKEQASNASKSVGGDVSPRRAQAENASKNRRSAAEGKANVGGDVSPRRGKQETQARPANLGGDAPSLYHQARNASKTSIPLPLALERGTGGEAPFLRGKHDACVWPLTGHVPMDTESWTKYFATCQDYGINHVRFHSWCPPEAAFTVADSLGIVLQPELPFWGDFNDKDTTLMTFLHKEGINILREYGHHPSFRMMALGNELWGSIEAMKRFTDDFRKIAPDKLYTFGSNYYLGYQGIKEGMDYFTTCRIGGEAWGSYNTHTRGSFSFADAYEGGMLNHCYPNSLMNFDEACDKATVPIISHETGQFQTFPDFDEIKKYTGVLRPCNLETFRRRLEAAGMLEQAKDFHKASGLWSVRLYKADIEMDLRTRNMKGFQLLDLQDYPGQGTACVGILDAFMESKGLVSADEWRQWCSEVVPLLLVPKFCYAEGDTLKARLQIANYGGKSLQGQSLEWRIGTKHGSLPIPDGQGLIEVGTFSVPVAQLLTSGKAVKEQLRLSINDGRMDSWRYGNKYELWLYPAAKKTDQKGIIVTHTLTADIEKRLNSGASVLWMPTDSVETPHTVGALFQTDYWNYRMFKTICENNKKAVSPGTLGLLTEPSHAIFNDFPTDMHTNWQWFDIVKHSRPLVLDNFDRDYRPVVQVIDNVERNHKLGLIMEWRVGKGKLLVCMSDLDKVLAEGHPEGRAFYQSVIQYMQSEHFVPSCSITTTDLRSKLAAEPRHTRLQELNNISQY